jgi:hypothetical protein
MTLFHWGELSLSEMILAQAPRESEKEFGKSTLLDNAFVILCM